MLVLPGILTQALMQAGRGPSQVEGNEVKKGCGWQGGLEATVTLRGGLGHLSRAHFAPKV